jgi:hypothetical protein
VNARASIDLCSNKFGLRRVNSCAPEKIFPQRQKPWIFISPAHGLGRLLSALEMRNTDAISNCRDSTVFSQDRHGHDKASIGSWASWAPESVKAGHLPREAVSFSGRFSPRPTWQTHRSPAGHVLIDADR